MLMNSKLFSILKRASPLKGVTTRNLSFTATRGLHLGIGDDPFEEYDRDFDSDIHHGELLEWPAKIAVFIVCPAAVIWGWYNEIQELRRREREPFIPYPALYANANAKRFPFGDGIHTPMFNPAINAMPYGYEDVEDNNWARRLFGSLPPEKHH